MVITNDFVFLHYPKTGGTFCEKHITRVYRQSNRERLSNLVRGRPVRWCRTLRQHAGVHAIPRYARRLPKLATIRHPYDRWVSQYEFDIYAHYPEAVPNREKVVEEYPHFPDVSFPEFIRLVNKYFNKVQYRLEKPEAEMIGFYSAQFIGLFCPRPAEILSLPQAEITADLVRENITPNLTLLMTSNLNRELHDYLCRFGHDPAALAAILHSPKILPEKEKITARPENRTWRSYYTPEALEMVNNKERLIFELFPQFEMEHSFESRVGLI